MTTPSAAQPVFRFAGKSLLLDIEGTTSSIDFVYQSLFPYARKHLRAFLIEHWDEPRLNELCQQLIAEAGLSFARPPRTDEEAVEQVAQAAFQLMDKDAKTTALKALQGDVWEAGFKSGELKAHIYDDTPVALVDWAQRGLQVWIYSSGSVAAQILFFSHTLAGSLLPLLRGHFDTTVGPKREPESYRKIVQQIGCEPGEVLFISDVSAELDAAGQAGLQTALMLRPGNPVQPVGHGHPELTSLTQIRLAS